MFDDMYKEWHFLKQRNVRAYIQRQKDSCLYLIDKFSRWDVVLEAFDNALKVILLHLSNIHERQFRELGGKSGEKPPDTSFYYDEMMNRTDLQRVAVLSVMYERGRLRYDMLIGRAWEMGLTFPIVFRDLMRDAMSNRDLCLWYLLERHGSSKTNEIIKRVIEEEGNLMAKIDQRNSEK